MDEKIKHLIESGTVFFSVADARAIELANAALQNMRASVLLGALANFYMSHGGAALGDAYVFPVEDAKRINRNYTVPGILKVNRDLSHLMALRGKTVWGRNQFYIFSCEVSGSLYMHDVLTFQILRKYADFNAVLTDCLLVGKV